MTIFHIDGKVYAPKSNGNVKDWVLISRAWQSLCLWFFQRRYDAAMTRGDLADANWWAKRMERVGRW